MRVAALLLILGGLAAIIWGLPAAHRLRRPWDILAALLVLCGTMAALVGALLVVVPGFFG
ncbi:hypothetical protein GURASL_34290 [Geotalea uraniireducens]|uniref:Uncharacterized protein n=1 Tax=Geotalea uraniireducens TaxID=351604 RepID=A0ABM8EQK9_9BACT|nr:hypothetical protein [Geotalea uraniireducens]BDV44506.1 hypothetical protein GURASL_34290 [Geotalea uraniireducens]